MSMSDRPRQTSHAVIRAFFATLKYILGIAFYIGFMYATGTLLLWLFPNSESWLWIFKALAFMVGGLVVFLAYILIGGLLWSATGLEFIPYSADTPWPRFVRIKNIGRSVCRVCLHRRPLNADGICSDRCDRILLESG